MFRPVGIAGFCMGGRFALIMSPKGFGASAPFYGTPLPRNLSQTLDGACPIVASFGSRDPLGIGRAQEIARSDRRRQADHRRYQGLPRRRVTASRTSSPPNHCFASSVSATTGPRPRTHGDGCSRSSTNIWERAQRRSVSARYFSLRDKTVANVCVSPGQRADT